MVNGVVQAQRFSIFILRTHSFLEIKPIKLREGVKKERQGEEGDRERAKKK